MIDLTGPPSSVPVPDCQISHWYARHAARIGITPATMLCSQQTRPLLFIRSSPLTGMPPSAVSLIVPVGQQRARSQVGRGEAAVSRMCTFVGFGAGFLVMRHSAKSI